MPRRASVTPGGLVYYVLNRTVAGLPLFRKQADYVAFEQITIETWERHPLRILAWCLMRTHWHSVVWLREEEEVTAYFRWPAQTHAMRYHVTHNTVGRGHSYQGRFKSFPIQKDEHFFITCRYVERNALAAWAIERAEDWRWGSRWARRQGTGSTETSAPAESPSGTSRFDAHASWRRTTQNDSEVSAWR